jgi:LysR family cyn operon transcriptional activator
VANGRLDLGIVTLPLKSRELAVQSLTNDDIVLVSRSDHPLAQRSQISPQALHDQGFVSFEADTALRNLIDSAVRGIGVELNVVMELRSIPSILRMVATTGHLAFVSRMALHDQSTIVEIRVKGLAIRRRLAVISRHQAQLSAAAAAFAAELTRNALPAKSRQSPSG